MGCVMPLTQRAAARSYSLGTGNRAKRKGQCRMRRQRLLLAAVPLSLLALVATACGGSSGGSGGSGGAKTGKAEFNGALNAIVNPSTAKGGTLNLSSTGDC